jgi:hypothetical protein
MKENRSCAHRAYSGYKFSCTVRPFQVASAEEGYHAGGCNHVLCSTAVLTWIQARVLDVLLSPSQ